ncbi:TadE/TadG family type IV pilus assembly protein [Rhodopirellula halodulae]|uniref:TadE/TadG family type IV pilus assembly protein n=1 Tax=Rhodopirellula halodulae TaxID=2894198 RepID=UPI001E30A890|nr:TadE/TadG family type IV pilus assembly protein [Rhodopirellula sp. JC737]MCC9655254.1 pilus assembly protein [Rhodopirellula sp. JC737]
MSNLLLSPNRHLRREKVAERSGATATEFALLLPVILLLVFACCDFARIIHVRQVVANAARVGSLHGAMNRFHPQNESQWRSNVQQAIQDELGHLSIDSADAIVSVSHRDNGNGQKIIASEVSIPFRTIVQWPVLPQEVQVRHVAEFQQFR